MDGSMIGVAVFLSVIQLILIFAILKVSENTKEIVRILQRWERENFKK